MIRYVNVVSVLKIEEVEKSKWQTRQLILESIRDTQNKHLKNIQIAVNKSPSELKKKREKCLNVNFNYHNSKDNKQSEHRFFYKELIYSIYFKLLT